MALFHECTLQCAQKELDTSDIVREAIFRQLTNSFRLVDDPSPASDTVSSDNLKLHSRRAPWARAGRCLRVACAYENRASGHLRTTSQARNDYRFRESRFERIAVPQSIPE